MHTATFFFSKGWIRDVSIILKSWVLGNWFYFTFSFDIRMSVNKPIIQK